jgi:hypothetical protein
MRLILTPFRKASYLCVEFDSDRNCRECITPSQFFTCRERNKEFSGSMFTLVSFVLGSEIEPPLSRSQRRTMALMSRRGPLLEKNLSVRFGGLTAVADMSFEVREGEVLSLIGPNGAGKTTAFNAITGYLAPASGEVLWRGKKVNGLKTNEIAALGLVRTFQKTSLFAGRSAPGVLRSSGGKVTFEGEDITHASPRRILDLGIAHCPGRAARFPVRDGAREPRDGVLSAKGPGGHRSGSRAPLRALPHPFRAAQPGRGYALGRRAADARHLARADVAAEARAVR